MFKNLLVVTAVIMAPTAVTGYAFVSKQPYRAINSPKSSSSLKMVDQQVLLGAGVAIAGLAGGIGLVAFTEAQGERAKVRGGGLSDSMSTRLAGGLLEDVEVSSVDDLGSLTSQLERALQETGALKKDDLEWSEEEKQRLTKEADDGW